MNQGNNQNNVTPTPMPATPNTNVTPTKVPATLNASVAPTPVNGLNFAQAPSMPNAPVTSAQPQVQVPVQQPVQPAVQNVQTVQNPQNTVTPTEQTIVNTTKKKGSNFFLFLIIILIGLFIYYIDDALAYFNQNHTPTVDTTIKENASANLIDGMIKINEENSYIKLKSVKFYNIKKTSENVVSISYTSDRNYSNSNNLNLEIELYDENKNKIYNETFNVFGTIESGVTRQYKITLKDDEYKEVFYAKVLEKTQVEEATKTEESTKTGETTEDKTVTDNSSTKTPIIVKLPENEGTK